MSEERMHRVPKPTGNRKPTPTTSEAAPSEADRSELYRLLLAGKATREESRTVVRYLLRKANTQRVPSR